MVAFFICHSLLENAVNFLQALQSYGQSAWLDYIRRSLLVSGQLKQLVDEDGLVISDVFGQITRRCGLDINVPERWYRFGVVESAWAHGDFTVLAERRRQALRVHLGADVSVGLNTLHGVVVEALDPLLVLSTSKTGG
ncbi:MAG: hypothetical protein H7Y22_09285 [Gemmatimonadaceae bacterium]|nr:hypothetical protein [Gloeobacterales cyanobacterium ES-bin-141]